MGRWQAAFELSMLVRLPLVPQLVDGAHDLMPGQFWAETLEGSGMGSFAAELGRELRLRHDIILGKRLRGKLGRMLGND